MRYVTIRNLPPDLAGELEQAKRRSGRSLNQTVIDLLRRALGLGSPPGRSNGLADLAGTWTDADLERFEADTEETRRVDDELWR